MPSRVAAGVDFRRRSFCRSRPSCDSRSRYSASTSGSGLTISTPLWPSTISVSPSLIDVARVVQADDRRDAERARHDRGVRGDAADVGDEAAEAVLLEQDHVGGREVVRHHDQLLLLRQRRLGRPAAAHHLLQHALDRLLHVGLALAQVGVVDLVEAVAQLLHLLHQRPFGVGAAGADQLARHLRQRRVVEDHAVQIQKCLELGRRAGRDVRLQVGQLVLRRAQRGVEARDLGLDLVLLDLVVRHLEPRASTRGAPGRS